MINILRNSLLEVPLIAFRGSVILFITISTFINQHTGLILALLCRHFKFYRGREEELKRLAYIGYNWSELANQWELSKTNLVSYAVSALIFVMIND